MKTVHIIGGGITGCSLAYFLKDKYRIILHEKTDHLGGLSRTFYSIENIPYQKGFHILHTNHQWIINIIKRANINLQRVFYDVAINPLIDFKYYRFPFNEESIKSMPWHWKEATLQDFNKVNGASGSNLKETIENFYGSTIYNIFYKGYIQKITGCDAEDINETAWFRKQLHSIDKAVNFYNEDCYFPVNEGWNKLFDYMTQDAEVIYNSEVTIDDFKDDDFLVITTRPDEFFFLSPIPYIGFRFEIDSVSYDERKPDTIIFPNDVPFLSMSQYGKLFSPQLQVGKKNIIVKDFPQLHNGESANPVITKENLHEHNNIINFIKQYHKHTYLCGPLATYKHMSMAESIEDAHRLAGEIKHNE
jgi:UDP-galactopyranose mutase